ncbi:MAG: IS1 family transposase [Chloroflexi bacterium]|nr:IS1 family transposase [Chloroflexota bacterium]
MNKLSQERRVQVVKALVEGSSINGTVRMTGVAKNTILKLLAELGSACLDYQDVTLRNLNLRYIECDEIWEFCYAKEKNVPAEHKGEFGYGDVWTWTAIDADTKLVPCWHVGGRSGRDAWDFIANLRSRLATRVQLTTDGYRAYLEAIEGAFGADIDYGVLNKIYGHETREDQRRYSPAECIGAEKKVVAGDPDKSHVSTSYVERQNLTMRMSMRRFTRLTNGFSKKVENHMHAISLHFMNYNFARPHKTLSKPYPTTPAMAAGLADHVWSTEEIVSLLGDSN